MRSSLILSLIIFLVLATSCKRNDKDEEYKYATSAEFSWGYAQFYGEYYGDVNINKNVVSLSLFTDSLKINDNGKLAGFGQYLFLEDIFSALTDTVLPQGTYNISDSHDAFTIAKGEIVEIDGLKYNVGAFVYFIEKNALFSKLEPIIDGNFTLNYNESKYYMMFDFLLSDSSRFTGRLNFKTLPFIDESEQYKSGVPRQKLGLELR